MENNDGQVVIVELLNCLGVKTQLITEDVINFFYECVSMTKLYAAKNRDYGNSFSKGCEVIGDAYAVGRLYDKMNRMINLSKNKAEVKDESLSDTARDLACYSVMYSNVLKDRNKKAKDGN